MNFQNSGESKTRAERLRRIRAEKERQKLNQVSQRSENLSNSTRNSQKPSTGSFRKLNDENNPLAKIEYEDKNYTTKKLKLSWRYLSAVIAILSGYFLFSAWRSPKYQVSEFEIIGNQRVNQDQILNTQVSSESKVILLSPTLIRNILEKNFPEFSNIEVSIQLPNKIKIEVEEMQPIMRWNFAGNSVWINEEGYLLPIRGETEVAFVIQANQQPPYFTTPERLTLKGEKRLRKTVIKKGDDDFLALFNFFEQIDPNTFRAVKEMQTLLPDLNTILFNKNRGFGWNDSHGIEIFVGMDLKDIAYKTILLEDIIEELLNAGIQPSTVSVEQTNAPYYRLD